MTASSNHHRYWRWLIRLTSLIPIPSFALAQEKVSVFPTTPVDVYSIYTNLAIFWLAIIAVIIVLKMKLSETERTQKLGLDRNDPDSPLLE